MVENPIEPRRELLELTAEKIIEALGLQPHPAGGFYGERFRDFPGEDGRARSTSIYYLLRAGEVLRWHHIDTAEIWHWYDGHPVELSFVGSGTISRALLGPNVSEGERPQVVIQARAWQCARPLGSYALCGWTATPGFELSKLEVAPEGWTPRSHF
jgi:predicted cupin superfamily sugar epimerase